MINRLIRKYDALESDPFKLVHIFHSNPFFAVLQFAVFFDGVYRLMNLFLHFYFELSIYYYPDLNGILMGLYSLIFCIPLGLYYLCPLKLASFNFFTNK